MKTLNEIWDFFEYLAQNTWENDHDRETFSHPSPNSYMKHVTPLDGSQFEGYLMSTFILHVLLFHVNIVIPFMVMLILIHCLVDHID